jgi:hypothetical protein
MGKKSKLMSRVDLRNGKCNGSAMADAMKGDFPNTVRDIVQANHRHSALGVDKPYRILHS